MHLLMVFVVVAALATACKGPGGTPQALGPQLVWQHQYGRNTDAETFLYADDASDGSLWMLGLAQIDYALGTSVPLVVHYSAAGELLSASQVGSPMQGRVLDVAACPDDGATALMLRGDELLLLRIDSDGNLLWARRLAGAMDFTGETASVAVDEEGRIYAKCDADSLAPPFLQVVPLTCLDPDGSLLWSIDVQSNGALAGLQGGVVLGESEHFLGEPDECFMTQFDRDGAQVWRRQLRFADGSHPLFIGVETIGQSLYVGLSESAPDSLFDDGGAVYHNVTITSGGEVTGVQSLAHSSTPYQIVYSVGATGRAYFTLSTGELFCMTPGQDQAYRLVTAVSGGSFGFQGNTYGQNVLAASGSVFFLGDAGEPGTMALEPIDFVQVPAVEVSTEERTNRTFDAIELTSGAVDLEFSDYPGEVDSMQPEDDAMLIRFDL